MHISKVINYDTVNGDGIGLSIFVSGCTFNCSGCYNSSAWDFTTGEELTTCKFSEILSKLTNPNIDHLSILGGEPLHPDNLESVLGILKAAKTLEPEKKIWLWTGYTRSYWKHVGLEGLVDFLIDGQFIQEQPTKKLWRGSDNQKLWLYNGTNWEEE